jgi:hypothetical protein
MVGEESLLLPVVGPGVPDLIGEVATEVTSQCSGSRVLAVEKPTGGEVVRLLVELVLLVGGEGVVRVVLQITKALEQVLCGDVPQRLRPDGQSGSSPSLEVLYQQTRLFSKRQMRVGLKESKK